MSDVESLLKRHGFLIAGVTLPLLVVIGLVLARALPQVLVEPPSYEMVYAVPSYEGSPQQVVGDVAAVDGRLRVRWVKTENAVYQGWPRVYRLDAASGVVQELPLPEPEDLAALDGPTDRIVAGLEAFRIDTSPRAPDGYEFEAWPSRGSGLMGELFGGRRQPESVVRKQGRTFVLPRVDDSAYGHGPVQFLGWLVPLEQGR